MRLLYDPIALKYALSLVITVVALLIWASGRRSQSTGLVLLTLLFEGLEAFYMLVLLPLSGPDPTVVSLLVTQTLRAVTWGVLLRLLWPHLSRFGRYTLTTIALLGTAVYYTILVLYALAIAYPKIPVGPALEILFNAGLALGSFAALRRQPSLRWFGLSALCRSVAMLWFAARLPMERPIVAGLEAVALLALLPLLSNGAWPSSLTNEPDLTNRTA